MGRQAHRPRTVAVTRAVTRQHMPTKRLDVKLNRNKRAAKIIHVQHVSCETAKRLSATV